MEYRKCFVPSCGNNSKNCPNKIFVRIREDLREKWCREAGAEYYKIYTMYCCEDHFNPIEDLKNYHQHKLINQEPRLKPTASFRRVTLNKSVNSPALLKLLLQDTSTTNKLLKSKYEDTIMPSTSSCSKLPGKSEDNHEASADKIRCPKCSTEIEMKQYVQDRVNAILVNVYRYFATEGTKLSPSQLRERTALCTGASEADVECALVLHQEVSATQKPLRKPPRKRRKKESKSPPPIQEEEPYIERETLIVAVDPKAGDANSEINPLAIKEEQPSSPITCEQDASLCEPLQSGLKPEDMAKVFVKTEPSEEPNIGPTQSSRPEQSSGGGPTPDIPPDTYFMIKNEEIDIEDNCGSGAESEEGYS